MLRHVESIGGNSRAGRFSGGVGTIADRVLTGRSVDFQATLGGVGADRLEEHESGRVGRVGRRGRKRQEGQGWKEELGEVVEEPRYEPGAIG